MISYKYSIVCKSTQHIYTQNAIPLGQVYVTKPKQWVQKATSFALVSLILRHVYGWVHMTVTQLNSHPKRRSGGYEQPLF